MKVIQWLAAVVLISACSDRPGSQQEAPPEPAAPVATAGEEPEAPTQPPRRAAESIEVRDARAAETGPATQAAAEAGVNTDAAVLEDFQSRVKQYLEIHEEAAKGPAKLKETEDPSKITGAQDTLAARIRTARANAKQGDIFTPEIRARFRRLLAPELKGEEGRDAKALMKDDAPAAGAIPFKVNAKYPEGQPVPTVPSNLLLNLPTLPDPMQYRIIGRHLVLIDSDAELIVDYIPNAIK